MLILRPHYSLTNYRIGMGLHYIEIRPGGLSFKSWFPVNKLPLGIYSDYEDVVTVVPGSDPLNTNYLSTATSAIIANSNNYPIRIPYQIILLLLEKDLTLSTETILNINTFSKLLQLRSLTGVARVAEHQMLNYLSPAHSEYTILLKDAPDNLMDKLLSNKPYVHGTRLVMEVRKSSDFGTLFVYYVVDEVAIRLIVVSLNRESLGIHVFDTLENLDNNCHQWVLDVVKPYIIPNKVNVSYVHGYSDQGTMLIDYRSVVIDDAVTSDLYYPYIEGGIDKLISSFMASNNDLLFLIGPPGTGKSSLIRNIISKTSGRNIYQWSGDTTILHPAFTSCLATLPAKSMVVLEDADNLMMPRSEGNAQMSMLLNEINGITGKGHKYIFSTNLENLRMVDPAILRKGRCFEVLEMRSLTKGEVEIIAAADPNINLDRMRGCNEITLGDLLSDGNEVKSRKFGF